ncbi:hypothetical protein GCM10010168_24710 [Actinoplanes ianthinogenes]|uniref:Uncharacterized protein n=1 Tax=Actinoplanes ianthinogenes TaxID=122358 RepID=A0ABM7M913_9ACTN|nr:hypothetical protein [Actinoplanes ianthinogenes]BCJ48111.1 hypothetical protein Aiant_87680 [Actinoplanes ianthinogenes]GGR06491.1 hypothetical protein GCM10010168_24710 [Actinoplanes ianthinogenes]
MSAYIAFFAAPGDSAAAAVHNSGPAGRYPLVAADDLHFDADELDAAAAANSASASSAGACSCGTMPCRC